MLLLFRRVSPRRAAGWGKLLAVRDEAHQTVLDQIRQQPSACPRDGTPSQLAPNGRQFCKFDGWRESFFDVR